MGCPGVFWVAVLLIVFAFACEILSLFDLSVFLGGSAVGLQCRSCCHLPCLCCFGPFLGCPGLRLQYRSCRYLQCLRVLGLFLDCLVLGLHMQILLFFRLFLVWVALGGSELLWAAVGCSWLICAPLGLSLRCCGLLWACLGCSELLRAALGCCRLLHVVLGCSGLIRAGGSEFARRQAPPKPGNRFLLCVHARGPCRVEMHLKLLSLQFRISLCAWGPLPFPSLGMRITELM